MVQACSIAAHSPRPSAFWSVNAPLSSSNPVIHLSLQGSSLIKQGMRRYRLIDSTNVHISSHKSTFFCSCSGSESVTMQGLCLLTLASAPNSGHICDENWGIGLEGQQSGSRDRNGGGEEELDRICGMIRSWLVQCSSVRIWTLHCTFSWLSAPSWFYFQGQLFVTGVPGRSHWCKHIERSTEAWIKTNGIGPDLCFINTEKT